MSIKNGHVRWAFDLKAWRCSLEDLHLATALIQPEEKERLAAFVYLDDFKASIIGRLLMKRFIKMCVPEVDYTAIHFERDAHGKPSYKQTNTNEQPQINFNVSHHERYAVLAGSIVNHSMQNDSLQNIGIDLMNTNYNGGRPLPEFFRIMQRTFTPHEWHFIKEQNNERTQAAAFMRHWSLKESYVKNIGVGITVNLQSIEFRLSNDRLQKENVSRDTVCYVNGELLDDWLFEESLLDDEHCVAVAVKNPTPEYLQLSTEDLLFETIDFRTLMQDAVKIRPFLAIDEEYCQKVLTKELKKPF